MKIDLKQLPKARLEFIPPMLAKPTEQLPSGVDWVYELKLDGYRTTILKKRGKMTMFSRRGNTVNARYPKMSRSPLGVTVILNSLGGAQLKRQTMI